MTEHFEVKVGLHQGSALSPLLFNVVFDVITENVIEEPSWRVLYADDIVLVAENIDGDQLPTIKLGGENLKRFRTFKYLGSMVDETAGMDKKEAAPLRKLEEKKLDVAKMKMLRWIAGVARRDRIRNDYIRGTVEVAEISKRIQEARLRWFGHLRRRAG
ncbi:uncharacterized protein LOC119573544 [Penaeus monodon]|uniref:uncharacterized protein LOC119573544 n=1 Tax=Penaeus monodon TaxID=6687 RepID=UPI0018A6DDFC|nr:uncharacterized protein LOC119573544 [Penaeus monodon]